MSERRQRGGPADEPPHRIPVIEERAHIEVRRVDTERVRVFTKWREERKDIDATLEERRVHVERVPRDELLTAPPAPRQEGDTFIFPVTEEVLVVETRWHLVEEVRVREQREVHEERVPITLGRHDVVVERTPLEEGGDGRADGA